MTQYVCAFVILIFVTKVAQLPLDQHWVRITASFFIALGVRLSIMEGLFVFSFLSYLIPDFVVHFLGFVKFIFFSREILPGCLLEMCFLNLLSAFSRL